MHISMSLVGKDGDALDLLDGDGGTVNEPRDIQRLLEMGMRRREIEKVEREIGDLEGSGGGAGASGGGEDGGFVVSTVTVSRGGGRRGKGTGRRYGGHES